MTTPSDKQKSRNGAARLREFGCGRKLEVAILFVFLFIVAVLLGGWNKEIATAFAMGSVFGLLALLVVQGSEEEKTELAHRFGRPPAGMVVMPDVKVNAKDVGIGNMPSAIADHNAQILYERLTKEKPGASRWEKMPDFERSIWRRLIREQANPILLDQLKERMLDEPAISAAEDAHEAVLPAAQDSWDDTGWAEPMTEAVAAAFDRAIEELVEDHG